jgi:hypothetical protein
MQVANTCATKQMAMELGRKAVDWALLFKEKALSDNSPFPFVRSLMSAEQVCGGFDYIFTMSRLGEYVACRITPLETPVVWVHTDTTFGRAAGFVTLGLHVYKEMNGGLVTLAKLHARRDSKQAWMKFWSCLIAVVPTFEPYGFAADQAGVIWNTIRESFPRISDDRLRGDDFHFEKNRKDMLSSVTPSDLEHVTACVHTFKNNPDYERTKEAAKVLIDHHNAKVSEWMKWWIRQAPLVCRSFKAPHEDIMAPNCALAEQAHAQEDATRVRIGSKHQVPNIHHYLHCDHSRSLVEWEEHSRLHSGASEPNARLNWIELLRRQHQRLRHDSIETASNLDTDTHRHDKRTTPDSGAFAGDGWAGGGGGGAGAGAGSRSGPRANSQSNSRLYNGVPTKTRIKPSERQSKSIESGIKLSSVITIAAINEQAIDVIRVVVRGDSNTSYNLMLRKDGSHCDCYAFGGSKVTKKSLPFYRYVEIALLLPFYMFFCVLTCKTTDCPIFVFACYCIIYDWPFHQLQASYSIFGQILWNRWRGQPAVPSGFHNTRV